MAKIAPNQKIPKKQELFEEALLLRKQYGHEYRTIKTENLELLGQARKCKLRKPPTVEEWLLDTFPEVPFLAFDDGKEESIAKAYLRSKKKEELAGIVFAIKEYAGSRVRESLLDHNRALKYLIKQAQRPAAERMSGRNSGVDPRSCGRYAARKSHSYHYNDS
ncbi:MAG: hypothetical protein Q4A33_00255 [Candidatus Saccharibacteria bacterium]|nr:hypothetical protein [Candidatus Saccharibacteria bacterium]